jgi:cation diffusion facilitator family transporter
MDVKQKASLFAIISAAILAIGKFSVGLISGSMAVMSSGLDSLLDVFMSGMNFFAIKKAAKPADHEHQYGHGKAEDLAAIIQSLFIVFSGAAIIYTTIEKFLDKEAIVYSRLDIGVMVFSLVFTIAISTVLKAVGKKTGSHALIADALHYTSDFYSNSAAIIAIILTYYTGRTYFDLLFAVIIGLIIIFSAIRIFRDGLTGLMDTSIPEKVEMEIRDIIDTMPFPYAGYHKLRSRIAGNKKYLDFHLLICRKARIEEAHNLAEEAEMKMTERMQNIDVTIHIEPCPNECELTDETCVVLKKKIQKK